MFVASHKNTRVQKFNSKGKLLRRWDLPDAKLGYEQTGMAFDGRDRLYVPDTRGNRILVYDTKGKLLLQFGKRGSGNGQFNQPKGVALDGHGFLYVCDSGNKRIQKFKLAP